MRYFFLRNLCVGQGPSYDGPYDSSVYVANAPDIRFCDLGIFYTLTEVLGVLRAA